MDVIAQLIDQYGGTLNAAVIMGLLTLFVTRLGQRDTKKDTEKARQLAERTQHVAELNSLVVFYREQAKDLDAKNGDLRQELDQLENKCDVLQHRFLRELSDISDRLDTPSLELDTETDSHLSSR